MVGDAVGAADLKVMRVFILRAREIADLNYREFAQARIKFAVMSHIQRARRKAARAGRTVRKRAIQIEFTRQQIMMFGRQIGFGEITYTGHEGVLGRLSSTDSGLQGEHRIGEPFKFLAPCESSAQRAQDKFRQTSVDMATHQRLQGSAIDGDDFT